MAVPKLPLIVPKKAIPSPSMVVPKLSPVLSTPLLKKGPPASKSLNTGDNFTPTRNGSGTFDLKSTDKLTKLVSDRNFENKTLNSAEEPSNDVDSTNVVLHCTNTRVVPLQSFTSDGMYSIGSKLSLSNSRKASRDFFHDDLAHRVNNSSILTDLSVGSKRSFRKSLSNDSEYQNLSKVQSKSFSRQSSNFVETKETNIPKSSQNNLGDSKSDERLDVGYTPWLKIEKRINEIRSMASKEMNSKPSKVSGKTGPGLYDNYNSGYDEVGWNKELSHPLSYGMVQKLRDKRQFDLPKDNWKFINGFIRPRRKPFTSMSEMSKYFHKTDSKDQYELIKLLLACRDLEKIIEEQHTVLDMLDHDLREARDLFPDSLSNLNTKHLFGSAPGEEPFCPSSDVPLFIKGRVFLLPKESGTVEPNN